MTIYAVSGRGIPPVAQNARSGPPGCQKSRSKAAGEGARATQPSAVQFELIGGDTGDSHGSGECLLEGIDAPKLGYQCTEHVTTANTTHFVITKRT
jgi:hypothetical protein